MRIKFILAASALSVAVAAPAQTVAFSENFNGDASSWQKSFPVLLELDHRPPVANVRPLFTDDSGVARPWWRLKDSSASSDGFIGSHSAYSPSGKSNDWLVSRPIEIPTTGFKLTFGAQSFLLFAEDHLSDLHVFITEYQPSEGNLPTEPTMLLEKVPEGKSRENIELDFTQYELNLDAYAGKTIYLSFANLNDNKDILCLDDILIQRQDLASLSASSPRYVEKGHFTVTANYAATTDADLKNWKLLVDLGDGNEKVLEQGESLASGTSVSRDFDFDIAADKTVNWNLRFTADGMEDLSASGTVTGLDFIPYHKVLLEEATGIWCGNCPLGMYAIEKMTEHPEMKDYVVPVSLHMISGIPSSDYLTCDEYIYMSGLTLAPSMRIDRSREVTTFSIANDSKPIDLNNTLSVAHKVKNVHEKVTLFDLGVFGSFVTNGNDTTAVKAKVVLRPAMTLPGKNYKVGFILTENNVSMPCPPYNLQSNNFGGNDLESDMDGLTKAPKLLPDWRWQDVARGIYDFHGHADIVLPETLEMGKDYTYEVTIPVPDTELILENGKKVAPAVVAANLNLVAFILDEPAGYTAVNSDIFPMTEQAEKRITIAELTAGYTGVDEVAETDADAPAEYYTLDGIRVLNPGNGIYIMRQGPKVSKIIL